MIVWRVLRTLRSQTSVSLLLFTNRYLAYARKYVRPKLSAVASEVLQTYYLHLRQTFVND